MHKQRLHICPIPAFQDNYIWLLHNTYDAIVIDPGDAKPVLAALNAQQLNLKQILITHHHSDHTDGVEELLQHHSAQIYAPKYEQFSFKHIGLSDGDEINIKSLDLSFKVLWLPGHTHGHIAYLNNEYLFSGDVLFSAGCGRLFEGTPEEMLHSLNRLKILNPRTQVFCTHEYTLKNIEFALTLEPNNPALQARNTEAIRLRKMNQPTLPTTIEMELNINPFLRCNQEEIFKNSKAKNNDELSVFSSIRSLRNHY
jgi:hydroxyacylglutathione hydrolase